MSDLDYFRLLSRYNRWANQRLYEAVSRLDDSEYRRPPQLPAPRYTRLWTRVVEFVNWMRYGLR